MIKTNSLKAWILAARPKTLSAAAVPVLLGIAFAYRKTMMIGPTTVVVDFETQITGMPDGVSFPLSGEFQWIPAILCLLFAWVMQIDSNFVNDYFDFKHGNDDETRLGPKRACAEGWVTLPAMKIAIGVTTLLGSLIGLPLVWYGGWEMVIVGILCVIFCFLYTTKLSYLGLGDVLVLLFFGIVPVCCTYYVCMPCPIQMPDAEVFLASVACGLVVDTLLVVNNYRDRANDRRAGKITLVVRLGEKNTEFLYKHLGYFGAAIMGGISIYDNLQVDNIVPIFLLFIIYIFMHYKAARTLCKIKRGRELNQVLGMTARNIFIFGLLGAVSILLVLIFK